MKRRCSSAADTSRTQGLVVTSPCIKGDVWKPGYRRVAGWWLDNMASHKYYNYIAWALPCAKRRLLVQRRIIALYCCVFISMYI